MKKRMSRILSVLLASVLVVSTGSVVEAKDTEGSVSKAQISEMVEAPEAGVDVLSTKDAKTIKPLQGAEESRNMLAQKVQGTYASTPVTLPSKGTVILAARYIDGGYYYGLFYDEALDSPVDGTRYMGGSSGIDTYVVSVPKGGKYYVGAYVYSSSANGVTPNVSYGFYDGTDQELKNKKFITVGQKKAQTNYFKFKAPYTGSLKVEGNENAENWAYCKVTLLKKNKKTKLSGATSIRYKPTYGVKKGEVYYIKVKSEYNSSGTYNLKVTNKKISEKKDGKKKAKAINLKKSKEVKGVIQAGSKQAYWYKFKLNGKKNVTINFNTESNDELKMTVYQGGSEIGRRTNSYTLKRTVKSAGKWPKGTYYIKVERGNKNSSGSYSLKWK